MSIISDTSKEWGVVKRKHTVTAGGKPRELIRTAERMEMIWMFDESNQILDGNLLDM